MDEYITARSTMNLHCPAPYVGQKEKDDLRELITMYIDSLLEIAIEKGEYMNKPVEDLERLENISKIFSPHSQTDLVLDGISLLYSTDIARANARMRQYFENVQKIPDIQEQLVRCYAMLRCVGSNATPTFPWIR